MAKRYENPAEFEALVDRLAANYPEDPEEDAKVSAMKAAEAANEELEPVDYEDYSTIPADIEKWI